MIEPLFGTTAPAWPSMPSPAFGWPSLVGTRPLPATAPACVGIPQPLGGPLFGQPPTMAPPGLIGGDQLTGFNVPAVLAAVAIRRGQPLGPTTDQDLEDFLYDTLDVLPGASEIDVRVDGGR